MGEELFRTVEPADPRTAQATRANLPRAIADDLRRQIAQGRLPPGSQLPGHRDLAAHYSVSVGSVREAISMLKSSGVIETRAGRGTFVVDASAFPLVPGLDQIFERKAIEELIEAREVLELQIVELAARRATPEQLRKVRSCVEHMRDASSDPESYSEADVEFHLALAEAAGNRFLLRAMTDIRSLLRKDMTLGADAVIRRFGDLGPSVRGHRAVVEALEAGDGERARSELYAIISRHHEFVLSLYAWARPEPLGASTVGARAAVEAVGS